MNLSSGANRVRASVRVSHQPRRKAPSPRPSPQHFAQGFFAVLEIHDLKEVPSLWFLESTAESQPLLTIVPHSQENQALCSTLPVEGWPR
eukprot:CAMPEP_0171665764 /NCGR_PEP_ID=MMETSP0990-20121206/47661_1 /TAXON_ID=483369 /ORGANISM="non described non described, Strain CCMP2098" /LENGTH=89 /DNA_ID=CAMNT_0012249071 /DNA_START=181 /DNA_END=447 /DNA_ORIENTATION=-